MMRLEDILANYLEDLQQYEGFSDHSKRGKGVETVKEGQVLALTDASGLPFMVSVLNTRGEATDVALMSYAWELGTEFDLLVRIKHPIREVWLVELDLVYTVPTSALRSFSLVGQLDSSDLTLARQFVAGTIEALPSNRCGTGSFLKVKKQFKQAELERSAWLAGKLLEWVDAQEGEIDEEAPQASITLEEDVIRQINELVASYPAAATGSGSFLNESLGGLFHAEKGELILHVNQRYQGRHGRIILHTPTRQVRVYEGPFTKSLLIRIHPVNRHAIPVFEKRLEVQCDDVSPSSATNH